MSIDLNPSSPIVIRFQHDLQLNDKGTRTQQSYVPALRRFTEFLRREPDTATEDDIRRYILHIKNKLHWNASTIAGGSNWQNAVCQIAAGSNEQNENCFATQKESKQDLAA